MKIGETVIFRNTSAYTGLDGSYVKILAMPDSKYRYYSVEFLTGPYTGKRMAASPVELQFN